MFKRGGANQPNQVFQNDKSQGTMVLLEGETSNTFFETLRDWNEQLKHVDFDIEEPRP